MKPTFEQFMRRVIPVTARVGRVVVDTDLDADALSRIRQMILDAGAKPEGVVSKILGILQPSDDLLQINLSNAMPIFLVKSSAMHQCRAIYRQAFK